MCTFIVQCINNVCVCTVVAQKGCGISTHGDTKNQTGHCPGQPVAADPAPAGLGPGDLKRLLPASMILGFVFPLRF